MSICAMKNKAKPFTEMNARELAAATREFDVPFVVDKGRPLNARERRQHLMAARRGPGRPRIGAGAQRINITIERQLLKAADAMAAARGMKRSELLTDAPRLLLRKA
jgi:hypothetical protein